MNTHFVKGDMQMVNKHVESCSTSSLFWEIHIKTRRRYPSISSRMTIIREMGNNKGLGRLWGIRTLLFMSVEM